MIKLVTVLAALCLSGAPGCMQRTPQRYDSQFITMGTQAQLSIWADTPTQAAQISKKIEQQLNQQSIDWYAWSPQQNSELRRLNAALKAGQPFQVSESLADLLHISLAMHKNSQGYFDPAIMPMTVAWGFADSNLSPMIELPSQRLLQHWSQHRPRLADLTLRDHTVSSLRQDLQIDLGAIAKGYALDLAIQQLQREGITQASLNLGGQVLLIGNSLPTSITEVKIQSPRSNTFLGQITLKSGESISTSGDYWRNNIVNDRAIHHLLDPHTGSPVSHTQAVTVIATSGVLADTASTALMTAGPEHWPAVARALGIQEVLRIDSIGNIQVTASLHARLRLTPETLSHHSIQIVTL